MYRLINTLLQFRRRSRGTDSRIRVEDLHDLLVIHMRKRSKPAIIVLHMVNSRIAGRGRERR